MNSPDAVNEALKTPGVEGDDIRKLTGLPYGCAKCDGYGNVLTKEGARPCECKRQYFADQKISTANIPGRFGKKGLHDFKHRGKEQQVNWAFAKWYVQQFSREQNQGLLLIGPPGVGKTHLTIGILKELIHRGFTGRFFNILDMLDAIKASYDPEIKATQGLSLTHDLDVDILVIDDLGAERMNAWVADRLYAIINQRYQDNRTLILTTNLTYADLGDRVGQRILSRLYEMCILHPCKGEDFRDRHKKEIKEI